MQKQKIAGTQDKFLVSSNNYEDDDCPVCQLMRMAQREGREPTMKEIDAAMAEAVMVDVEKS
ncbi:MAG: hypothetical protein WCO79_01705 [bacterium]